MKIGIVIIIVGLVAVTGIAMADKQPGAVMAVDQNGLDQLYPTTEVYIKSSKNLAPSSPFTWDIYDKDVTCPPGEVISPEIGCAKFLWHGDGGSTNGNGEIIPYQDTGWSIPDGDYADHPYKLRVTIYPVSDPLQGNAEYADVYTKIDSFEPIPEMRTLILTSVGILGILLISRKYRRK